jgi:hypothetical protein
LDFNGEITEMRYEPVGRLTTSFLVRWQPGDNMKHSVLDPKNPAASTYIDDGR